MLSPESAGLPVPGQDRSRSAWPPPTSILDSDHAPESAAPRRLDRKCRLGVSFDLITGRLTPGRETAASVLASFLLGR